MAVRKGASRWFGLGVVGMLAASGTACSSTTESPGEERRPGLILGFSRGDPQIVVPDTVQAGTEFTVEVTTYGNRCYRKGETEVAASGSVVTITPWNYVDLGADACSEILLTFFHQATVEFSQAGWPLLRARVPVSRECRQEAEGRGGCGAMGTGTRRMVGRAVGGGRVQGPGGRG